MKHTETKYGDSKQPVDSVEFAYSLIDERVFNAREAAEEEKFEQLGPALRMFVHLVRWLWQDGMNNPEGLLIRATIVCWIFLPHLRPLTLTDIAAHFRKDKQSLGRWVEKFKLCFPYIKTPHMK